MKHSTQPENATDTAPVWIAYSSGIAWGTLALFVSIVMGYGALIHMATTEAIALPWQVLWSTGLLYVSFTVVHEAGHGNIAHEVLPMKRAERLMGWLASLPFLVVPFALFARIHDFHHAFTNDPERDPDFWVSGAPRPRAFWHAFLLAFKYIILTTTRFASHPTIARTHASSVRYYLVTATVMVLLIASGHVDELFWLGIVPVLLASFVLGMLFDWIPHTPALQQGRYQNTRTYLFPGLNVLTLGQSYHHIHHLYPRVTWYRYKRVFNAIRPELEAHNAPIETLFSRGGQPFLESPFAQAPVMGQMHHSLTLTVASITQETPEAVRIAFAPTRTPLAFKAGQYLTVRRWVEGETVTRCYSICEPPSAGTLAIGVKRVRDGKLSNALNSRLQVGDKLSVSGPFGNFFYDPNDDVPVITLIAGGSGITPVFSILQTAIENDSVRFIHLIYANRSMQDTLFLQRLNALALKNSERLKITFGYENAPADWQGPTGWLTADLFSRLLQTTPESMQGRFYICGPAPMKDLVMEALLARAIPEDRIRIEAFVATTPEPQGAVHRVDMAMANGERYSLAVAENQTILQAATRAGVKIPHACGVGQCGCCMMRVIEGNSELAIQETPGLLPGERAQGLTLACQCKPRSDLLLQESITR